MSSELKVMCFNVLNSQLSKNPFEFENFYQDHKVKHFKNIQILFKFCDRVFNPKSDSKIDFLISDFLKDIVTEEMVSKQVKHASEQKESNNVERLNNIMKMKVWEVMLLFDKSNKELPVPKWDLASLDRYFEPKEYKFYMYKSENEVYALVDKLKEPTKDFHQILLDLVFRKIIKNFQDLFYFNQHLDIRNVILKEEHITKAQTILEKKIRYANTDIKSFIQENNEKEQIQTFFIEQNDQNTAEGKFKIILDTIKEKEIEFCMLCEISKTSQTKVIEMLRGTEYDYYPKDMEFKDEKDLVVINVQNSKLVSNLATVKEVDQNKRMRIVKLTKDGADQEIGCVHLASGDDDKFKEERQTELTDLFKDQQVSGKSFLMGDLNEHMSPDSKVVKKLKEVGFDISSEMETKLKEETVDKMRSAMQQQVSKIRKADKSTKDGIFGKKANYLDTYEILPQKISDHKMVIATIKSE